MSSIFTFLRSSFIFFLRSSSIFWCLVSGVSTVFGVWCVDGVWCLVSGGVLPLMKPPFWWVLSDAKFGSVVLWEGADDPPVWAIAKTAAGAGLLLVGGTAAEPRLNGGRPPHGGKKVASFLPKIHSNLLKILPEKFPLRPVSVDHPNLVYINCTPTTVTPGDCTHASECTRGENRKSKGQLNWTG